jgi:serine phosphatase RsbU (regulator of sigma subunit)
MMFFSIYLIQVAYSGNFRALMTASPVSDYRNEISLSYLTSFLIAILVIIAMAALSLLLIRTLKYLGRMKKAFDEIDQQREELQIKNKDLTDSLTYARRIQIALLPSVTMINKLVPDHFIFYRPKHIVSGDFYWLSQTGDKLYLAAADCTGHGVPGALMSMIGLEILQKIINESKVDHSDLILEALNKELESAFNKEEDGKATIKDGIEMSMCVLNTRTHEMEYSGAFLPVYIVRDERLIEIKGDKINVGQSIEGVVFTRNTLSIEPGDIIYLFSDGYADQFGGIENKKFMYRRLRHLMVTISKFPMEDQKRILEETIVSWMSDTDQIDDMMVMGFKPF